MSEDAFHASGQQFLGKLDDQPGVTVLVASRSILIMLWNMMRAYDGPHVARPWSFLEWVEFTRAPADPWVEGRTQRLS